MSTCPSLSSWSPSCCEMDSTIGGRVSCLCRPPVSTLVLLGKPEQTQHTRRPDLLGQQTRVWGPVFGQVPSPGTLPKVHPCFPGAGTESRLALFSLCLSPCLSQT